MRAISQRITIRYSLKELDLQSVEDYIRLTNGLGKVDGITVANALKFIADKVDF